MDINTKIKDILADPRAVEILDKLAPGLSNHPQKAYAMNMTLKGVQGFARGILTDEVMAKIDEELKALD